MFEKREVLVYQNVDMNVVMPQVADYWTRAGFYVTMISPTQMSGTGYGEDMGIKPQFFLNVFPQGGGASFDLNTRGEVASGSMVLLIILLIFFWPLALILGLLAFNKYDTQAKATMYNFWGFMNHITGQAGQPPYGAYQQQPQGGYAQPPPPQGQQHQQQGQPVGEQPNPKKKAGKKKSAT